MTALPQRDVEQAASRLAAVDPELVPPTPGDKPSYALDVHRLIKEIGELRSAAQILLGQRDAARDTTALIEGEYAEILDLLVDAERLLPQTPAYIGMIVRIRAALAHPAAVDVLAAGPRTRRPVAAAAPFDVGTPIYQQVCDKVGADR